MIKNCIFCYYQLRPLYCATIAGVNNPLFVEYALAGMSSVSLNTGGFFINPLLLTKFIPYDTPGKFMRTTKNRTIIWKKKKNHFFSI